MDQSQCVSHSDVRSHGMLGSLVTASISQTCKPASRAAIAPECGRSDASAREGRVCAAAAPVIEGEPNQSHQRRSHLALIRRTGGWGAKRTYGGSRQARDPSRLGHTRMRRQLELVLTNRRCEMCAARIVALALLLAAAAATNLAEHYAQQSTFAQPVVWLVLAPCAPATLLVAARGFRE
jgi:hypothetical protein